MLIVNYIKSASSDDGAQLLHVPRPQPQPVQFADGGAGTLQEQVVVVRPDLLQDVQFLARLHPQQAQEHAVVVQAHLFPSQAGGIVVRPLVVIGQVSGQVEHGGKTIVSGGAGQGRVHLSYVAFARSSVVTPMDISISRINWNSSIRTSGFGFSFLPR